MLQDIPPVSRISTPAGSSSWIASPVGLLGVSASFASLAYNLEPLWRPLMGDACVPYLDLAQGEAEKAISPFFASLHHSVFISQNFHARLNPHIYRLLFTYLFSLATPMVCRSFWGRDQNSTMAVTCAVAVTIPDPQSTDPHRNS